MHLAEAQVLLIISHLKHSVILRKTWSIAEKEQIPRSAKGK